MDGQEDDENWRVTEEQDLNIKPIVPHQTKNIDTINYESQKCVDQPLEEKLRISLSDFYESNFSSNKRASRNLSKDKNTIATGKQSTSVPVFHVANLTTENSNLLQTLPSTGSIV